MTITRSSVAGLCALVLAGTAVNAADFDGSYPPPRFDGDEHRPPPPPVFRGPRFAAGPDVIPPERCRVFLKRRFDPYGDEVVHRVRVCDEPAGFDRPFHRPAYVDGPPRPPADIPYRAWDAPYDPRR